MAVIDPVTGREIGLEALAFIAPPATVGNVRPRLGLKTSYYDAELVAQLKAGMPSGQWHPEPHLRCHTWPLTTASCRKLWQIVGPSMKRQPELSAWFREQRELEEQREAVRAAELERRSRVHAEQVKLDAEAALYGASASSQAFPTGTPAPLDGPAAESIGNLVVGARDVARTPVSECEPVDARWIAAGGDDWRAPLQEQGAAWLSQNGGGVLVDEVGLGKSRTTLWATTDPVRALVGVHLVVAPLKVARLTWPKEIKRWVPEAGIIPWPLGESGRAAEQARERAVGWCKAAAEQGTKRPIYLVLNHHAVGRYAEQLAGVRWASIIVDEADQVLSIGHRGSGKDTKNAAGLMRLQTHPDGLRVPATGTPFRGRLGNLWGLLDFCHPGAFGPKVGFTDAYTTSAGEFGSGVTLDRVMPGREAAWSKLMGGWVLRRTRLAEQRALIEHRTVMVEPLPEQLEQDAAWKKRDVWTGPHEETAEHEPKGKVMMRKADGVILPDTITAVTRRLQLAVGPMHDLDDAALIEGAKPTYKGPSPKVDWIIGELGQWGLLDEEWWWLAGEHGKVIIASPFTTGLDLLETRLREHLPPRAWVRIDGNTSMKNLDAAKDAFCAPRGPGILLLSSEAGGAGLTLDQHCCRVIIMSESWVADTQTQVSGRVENRTWETKREIITLRTSKTLDSYLGMRIAHQSGVQSGLLALAHAG